MIADRSALALSESPTAEAPIGDHSAGEPLSVARPGRFLCTDITDKTLCSARMNSLGICVGRPLELVSSGDPMIVRVSGSAVGLSRLLAAKVLVSLQSDSASA